MTQTTDQPTAEAPPQVDLATAIQRVLAESSEPLTLAKIRSHLPATYRAIALEELGEVLKRQAAANVLYEFPKYRSKQERYWDRPMAVHVTALVLEALGEGPLGASELRRKLPVYAVAHAEVVLQEQIGLGFQQVGGILEFLVLDQLAHQLQARVGFRGVRIVALGQQQLAFDLH